MRESERDGARWGILELLRVRLGNNNVCLNVELLLCLDVLGVPELLSMRPRVAAGRWDQSVNC